MIGEIDLCMSFIGENSGLLANVFFNSFAKYCTTTDITLHLARLQVSSEVWDEVVKHAKILNVPTLIYNINTEWKPYGDKVNQFSISTVDTTPINNNAAETAAWCTDNCGNAEWCILSHFDVIWRGDIIRWLKTKQAETGADMVGSHCPIMLLNRAAYRRVNVPFDIHPSVSDVGVELGKALNTYWMPPEPKMEWLFHHMGGGGGYHTVEEFESMRKRAIQLIHKPEWENTLITTLGGNYVIHLAYKPNGLDEPSGWLIACMPQLRTLNFAHSTAQPNYLRSDDTRAVTCPECKKTKIFADKQKTEPE